MPLTTAQRASAIIATRQAAAAFVEDICYIRDFLKQDAPLPREIRHLSAIMRRLLTDGSGDLRALAPPRIGKIELTAPDNSLFYGKFSFRPITMFLSGGPTLFGNEFRALAMGGPSEFKEKGFDKSRTVNLSLDGFISQRVLLFQHQWITRKEIIKYVAHITSGVHSGTAKEPVDLMLDRARRFMRVTHVEKTLFKIEFDHNAVFYPDLPSQMPWSQHAIDVVLIELRAAAHYLSMSPDIIRLEEFIRSELILPSN